jgi:hypothetical protein
MSVFSASINRTEQFSAPWSTLKTANRSIPSDRRFEIFREMFLVSAQRPWKTHWNVDRICLPIH